MEVPVPSQKSRQSCIHSRLYPFLTWLPIYHQPVYVGIYFNTFSTNALKLSIRNKKKTLFKKFLYWIKAYKYKAALREVIHNNYTLYYFVYMYTQICDENALIWGFPRRMFRPPPTWNFITRGHLLNLFCVIKVIEINIWIYYYSHNRSLIQYMCSNCADSVIICEGG